MTKQTPQETDELNQIETALKAGQVEQVWVIELTTGTPGISETTARWWIIAVEKAETEEEAIEYCISHRDRIGGHPVTSIFARRQVAIPNYPTMGFGDMTIPAADTLDGLKSLLAG